MKILFVDQSADLQQKYIEPLRKLGVGVVRARSSEDAAKMMVLHGDGLDAIVVHEKFVSFAEKQSEKFVVLTAQWGEAEIKKHQASGRPAFAYVSVSEGFEKIYSVLSGESDSVPLSATGTDGVPIRGNTLVSISAALSRPEPTRTFTRSLSLNSPFILLGGIDIRKKPEVEEMEVVQDPNRTTILEQTRLSEDLSIETLSPDLDPAPILSEEVPDEIQFESELSRESDTSIGILSESSPGSVPASLDEGMAREFIRPSVSVGSANSAGGPDIDTLKSYLALREQDVAVLTGQFRSSQERIKQLELQVKVEKARSTELQQMLVKSDQKIKSYDQDKQIEFEVMEKEMEDLHQQLKDRTEKVRVFEAKLRMTTEEVNKVKERVRVDIRRIRVREKELEGQLEILKKDSSALLQARDEKILELKRKVDLLEFNLELVQEQFQKERQASDDLKGRLKDAAQAMKQANVLLEQ